MICPSVALCLLLAGFRLFCFFIMFQIVLSSSFDCLPIVRPLIDLRWSYLYRLFCFDVFASIVFWLPFSCDNGPLIVLSQSSFFLRVLTLLFDRACSVIFVLWPPKQFYCLLIVLWFGFNCSWFVLRWLIHCPLIYGHRKDLSMCWLSFDYVLEFDWLLVGPLIVLSVRGCPKEPDWHLAVLFSSFDCPLIVCSLLRCSSKQLHGDSSNSSSCSRCNVSNVY